MAVPEITSGRIESEAIYRIYFHGPAYQVLEHVWRDGTRAVGEMKRDLPANHHPGELSTVMMPRMIELCFQTAGVWEIGSTGRMGLPQHVDRVRVTGTAQDNDGTLRAIVTAREDGATFDASVVDGDGRCVLSLEGYRTIALPSAIDAESLSVFQAVEA